MMANDNAHTPAVFSGLIPRNASQLFFRGQIVSTRRRSESTMKPKSPTVNVATRGGANSFHATIYEFIRNTKLNAIGYFAPTGGVKPQFNLNQFGANFGGAIVKDRLFYFVDYEGFRQVVQPVAFASVPLFNERAGILAVDVQDPFNGTIYTHGTSVLSSPNISPIARQVIGYLNTSVPIASTVTALSNNYRGSSRFTDNSDKGVPG
jgi:hypothetical protein